MVTLEPAVCFAVELHCVILAGVSIIWVLNIITFTKAGLVVGLLCLNYISYRYRYTFKVHVPTNLPTESILEVI